MVTARGTPTNFIHTVQYVLQVGVRGGIILVGSRALSFSDPYFHFTCLSVLLSFCLSVRNFGAKYLGNEAR